MKEEIKNIFNDIINNVIDIDVAEEKILKIIEENKKPSPYEWLLENKFQISKGSTYHEPNVKLSQAARWISEYVKLYCK